jgi:diadenosine tetraphosphatase ApaH/serine/threonine PP2A family protein phosphatase
VDQTICLGDCIGYGPEPEQVISEVRSRNLATIMGNHELALFDKKQLNWFNPLAGESLRKTRRMLSNDTLNFIVRLPSSLIVTGARCVHGFPPDSARTYLFQKSIQDLREAFRTLEERICFIGHTHFLDLVRFDGRHRIDHLPLERGIVNLDPDHRYIVNIGSVGQPRDRDNSAKYVLWEPDENRIEVRFVPYDIAKVVAKIKAAGLPEVHGRRLW